MIISEKQIMALISATEHQVMRLKDMGFLQHAMTLARLLDEISDQQSEELKDYSNEIQEKTNSN